MSANITAKKRLDYQPPSHLIPEIALSFNLEDGVTKVKSQLKIVKNGHHEKPLVLDGVDLKLIDIQLNGKTIAEYELTDTHLTLHHLPDECTLEIYTEIFPQNNSSLEGLYKTSGAYCTQCEAEGFRKITYFADRPDVLSEYTVTIYAQKDNFPFLLSNGNKIDSGDLDENVHWVKWHDPFKKPCYLFALVAGDFDLLEDTFTTGSGREVALELFVDKGKLDRGHHALSSLKKAMKWDEDVFGLEYDLDIYMIVAVDFFNMGAMENKGLNVFNSKFVLADSESATDEDYFNIESVIAHEYFHNWTGNRVTCRDWFQLSLKEGLTVFRDQQFSADMNSAPVNRIKNVKVIREHQFAEDASAMSHPIRPDEVIEMNNFYTVTVYDKGAEVIRMMHTLLGSEGFRKGMDLYFLRHDGQAVTCDDFVQAMQDANSEDLTMFRRWYGQSGTPNINVEENYNASTGELNIRFEQTNLPTADQAQKQDLHIPIKLEIIDDLNPQQNHIDVYNLKQKSDVIKKSGFSAKPTIAYLTDFSAPVKLDYCYQADDLMKVATKSRDGFSRWNATQNLYANCIHHLARSTTKNTSQQIALSDIEQLLDGIFTQPYDDKATLGEMLTLPSFETLVQQVELFNVRTLFEKREELRQFIAERFIEKFTQLYESNQTKQYKFTAKDMAERKLANVSLEYIALTNQGTDRVTHQFENSSNMTDTLGALKSAQTASLPVFDKLMEQFESRWRQDPLVLDKWFALHAGLNSKDILSRLELIMGHKQFDLANPNRVRSVIGTFAFYNSLGFHDESGAGYRFVTDYLIKLDKINPQVAARIVTPLTQWKKLDESRIELMKTQLNRLLDSPNISNDMFEKVSKSLRFQ